MRTVIVGQNTCALKARDASSRMCRLRADLREIQELLHQTKLPHLLQHPTERLRRLPSLLIADVGIADRGADILVEATSEKSICCNFFNRSASTTSIGLPQLHEPALRVYLLRLV